MNASLPRSLERFGGNPLDIIDGLRMRPDEESRKDLGVVHALAGEILQLSPF